jgi:hypothetical protein
MCVRVRSAPNIVERKAKTVTASSIPASFTQMKRAQCLKCRRGVQTTSRAAHNTWPDDGLQIPCARPQWWWFNNSSAASRRVPTIWQRQSWSARAKSWSTLSRMAACLVRKLRPRKTTVSSLGGRLRIYIFVHLTPCRRRCIDELISILTPALFPRSGQVFYHSQLHSVNWRSRLLWASKEGISLKVADQFTAWTTRWAFYL